LSLQYQLALTGTETEYRYGALQTDHYHFMIVKRQL